MKKIEHKIEILKNLKKKVKKHKIEKYWKILKKNDSNGKKKRDKNWKNSIQNRILLKTFENIWKTSTQNRKKKVKIEQIRYKIEKYWKNLKKINTKSTKKDENRKNSIQNRKK